jgi:phosphonate transport system ATP-binding protein
VIVVLHQPELARRYADRLVGFHEGRVAFDRPPKQVSSDEVDSLYGHDDDER